LRSPKDMGIIEIDITNACVHSCANCTRFCGHHKKPFFMGFDTFKKAVDSLADWEGIVGIIGGEPTLHPEFERFCDYLREKRIKKKVVASRKPIYDMQFHILSGLDGGISNVVLLSSLAPSYFKHYETINDTFSRQLLNDHGNDVMHQALLMPRKELGISDEEWEKKRDACWIQNAWSATITPKGAFFCEVAGSLDMLFDGPGGWPIEKDWYKRTPEDFKDQLHWCELCSACLDVPKRLSSEDRDDVTPAMLDKLKEIGSPKALNGHVVVRDPKDYENYKDATYNTGSEYIEVANFQRINVANNSLHDKRLLCATRGELAEHIKKDANQGYIAIAPANEKERIEKLLEEYVLNPGCFYILDDGICIFHANGRSIRDALKFPDSLREDLSSYYPADKIVRFSENHPYRCILAGVPLSEGSIPIVGKNTKLIIYGAGHVGKIVINYLKRNGINDFLVAVTEVKENLSVEGEKLYKIYDLENYKNDSVVLLAVTNKYKDEMKNILRKIGFIQVYDISF